MELIDGARHFINQDFDKEIVLLANKLKFQAQYLDDMALSAEEDRLYKAKTLYNDRFKPEAGIIRNVADELLSKLRCSFFPTREEDCMDFRLSIIEKRVAEVITSFKGIKIGKEGGYVAYPEDQIINDISSILLEKKKIPEDRTEVKKYAARIIKKWLGEGKLGKNPYGQIYYDEIGKDEIDKLSEAPDPQSFRMDILKVIDILRGGASSEYVKDIEIAQYLWINIEEVRPHLEILKHENNINLNITFGPKMQAIILPEGRKALEGIVKPPQLIKELKILFLAANPSNETRIHLDLEYRDIDQVIQRGTYRDHIKLIPQFAVRAKDMQGYLLRHSPDILHICGHGNTSNEIILVDEYNLGHPITIKSMEKLIRALKDNLRCVILNACYSEDLANAIAQHIDCVIGMSNTIADTSAISFSTAFYQAIAFGKDINSAFLLGCAQIDLQNLPGQETPKLVSTKIDPDKVEFFKG